MWLRVFIEDLVRLIGEQRPDRPHASFPGGEFRLVGDRLAEPTWQHLRSMYERTGTCEGIRAGFSWSGRWEARCEFQRDDGYDGALVWVEVADAWLAAGIRTAMARANRHWSTHPEVPRSLFTEEGRFA